MNNKDIQLSKSLSWLLRHGAVREGFRLSPEGYLDVNKILQHKTFRGKYSTSDIERVVNNNDKQRFKLRRNNLTNCLEIKANQGHTITEVSDADLIPITEVLNQFIFNTYQEDVYVHCRFTDIIPCLGKHFELLVPSVTDGSLKVVTGHQKLESLTTSLTKVYCITQLLGCRFQIGSCLNTGIQLYLVRLEADPNIIGKRLGRLILSEGCLKYTKRKSFFQPIYNTVIHGTYLKCWPRIKNEGLSCMKRKHIHLAKGTLDDASVISGLRQDAEVHIYIDLAGALANSVKFYESENGVILTSGNERGYLESKYFAKVVNICTGERLYP